MSSATPIDSAATTVPRQRLERAHRPHGRHVHGPAGHDDRQRRAADDPTSAWTRREATLRWIICGYALAFGIALIPAGRIGDRIGHKWVFFTGLLLFTVASLFCGLAQNSLQLIVARVVQGLAGGIFVPAVTAMIQLLFPGPVRGKAFAIMGSVIGVSTALGPILGGLIIEAFGDANGLAARVLGQPADRCHRADRGREDPAGGCRGRRRRRVRLRRAGAAHRGADRVAGAADRGPGRGLAGCGRSSRSRRACC